MPRSVTLTSTSPPVKAARTPIQRASAPYLIALPIRFWNTRRSAASSPATAGRLSAMSSSMAIPAGCAADSAAAATSRSSPDTATGRVAIVRWADWRPANSRICSTRSVSRRPSRRTSCPYWRIRASSLTTPSARLSAAERITASGVRSSCETVATNSSCWRARSCARRVDSTRNPTLTPRMPRMLVLTSRFRRLTALTACSSDPDGCFTSRRQCGDGVGERARRVRRSPTRARRSCRDALWTGGRVCLLLDDERSRRRADGDVGRRAIRSFRE